MNLWIILVVGATILAAGFVYVTWLNRRRSGFTALSKPSTEEIYLARSRADHALSMLSLPQHLRVRLTVRRGIKVDDHRLAPAAVLHARRQALVERDLLSTLHWPTLIGPALLIGFLAVPRLVSDHNPWPAAGMTLVFLGIAVMTLVRPLNALRRFERAERLNRDHPLPST